MDSEALRKKGFCEWKPFQKGVERLAPENKGVYAFRGLARLSLALGSSDVMCIGRATSDRKGPYHNLRRCLRQYLHPGHLQRTRLRVGGKALTQGWEISWMVTDSPEEVERHLLRCFRADHGQLPPENRAGPSS